MLPDTLRNRRSRVRPLIAVVESREAPHRGPYAPPGAGFDGMGTGDIDILARLISRAPHFEIGLIDRGQFPPVAAASLSCARAPDNMPASP